MKDAPTVPIYLKMSRVLVEDVDEHLRNNRPRYAVHTLEVTRTQFIRDAVAEKLAKEQGVKP